MRILNIIFALAAFAVGVLSSAVPARDVERGPCDRGEYPVWDVRCVSGFTNAMLAKDTVAGLCRSTIHCSEENNTRHGPYEFESIHNVATASLKFSCGMGTKAEWNNETCFESFYNISKRCAPPETSFFFYGEATSRCDNSTISIHRILMDSENSPVIPRQAGSGASNRHFCPPKDPDCHNPPHAGTPQSYAPSISVRSVEEISARGADAAVVGLDSCIPGEPPKWDLLCFGGSASKDNATAAVQFLCDKAQSCPLNPTSHRTYGGRASGVYALARLNETCAMSTPSEWDLQTCSSAYTDISEKCGGDENTFRFGQVTSSCDGSILGIMQARSVTSGTVSPDQPNRCSSGQVEWTPTCAPGNSSLATQDAATAISNACLTAQWCYNRNFTSPIVGSGPNGVQAVITLGDRCGMQQKEDFDIQACTQRFIEIDDHCGSPDDREREFDGRWFAGESVSPCDGSTVKLGVERP